MADGAKKGGVSGLGTLKAPASRKRVPFDAAGFLRSAGFVYGLCEGCRGSGLDYWGDVRCKACGGQRYVWKCPVSDLPTGS